MRQKRDVGDQATLGGGSGYMARIAQIAWVLIVLLQAAVFVLGIVVWFPAMKQLCTATALECQQRLQLTAGEASSLHALGYSLATFAWYSLITRLLQKIIGLGMGILLFWRRPYDAVAWVASIFLIVGIETSVSDSLAVSQPGWLLATRVLGFIGALTFGLFFYLFPTGKFAPRWTRSAMMIYALVFFVSNFFPDSPLSINQSKIGELVAALLLGSLVVAQIVRYRKVSDATARLQTKWVVGATFIGFAAFFASFLSILSSRSSEIQFTRFWILQDLGFSLLAYILPIAIAIAILRYRLWDIDVIIRKTLVYSILTAMLALVYFGMVVLLQGLFNSLTGQQSPVAIVISTLLIAALFTPLRRQVQRVIDRRFYRKKYNAQKVLAEFGQRARDETDMGVLTAELRQVVQETMQPVRVAVWLRSAEPHHAFPNTGNKEASVWYKDPSP